MPPGAPPVRLGYCTNVHRAETAEDLERMIRADVAPILRRTGSSDVGLRVGAAAAFALDGAPAAAASFRSVLAAHDARVFTVNGFPFGTFQSGRVKETVYLPDWASPERTAYTLALARLAASWARRDDPFVTISTAPLGFARGLGARRAAAVDALVALVPELERLEESSGVRVVVALEPEPACAPETAGETADLFLREIDPRARARLGARGVVSAEERVRERLGACFDACHQAVMGEDPDDAVRRLADAGVPVAKLQISNALRAAPATAAAVRALLAYDEPRFLHQTTQLREGAAVRAFTDLPDVARAFLSGEIPADDELRCHFHVPIDVDPAPPLRSTREHLAAVVRSVRRRTACRHFEVETYTFDVAPPEIRSRPLSDLVVAECAEARRLVASAT